MMLYLFGQLALSSALVTVLYLYAPRLALGGVLFGATVPEAFSGTSEGRAIVARFRREVAAAGVATLLAIGAACASGWVPLAGALLIAQIALSTAAWVAARARTRPHAVAAPAVRRAALRTAPESLHPLLELVPYLVLAAAAVAVAVAYDRFPERYPIHWGASGRADRFVDRSVAGAFQPILRGTAIVLLLQVLRAVTLGFTPNRVGDARGEGLRRFTRLAILGASVLVAAVHAAAALNPLAGGPAPVLVAAGVGAAVLLPALAIGAAKLASLPSPGPGDGTPDDRWRAGGLFYVNPDDPAIFVPKRVGLGYTINFGHTRGRLAMLARLAVPVAMLLVAALLGR